MSNNSHFMDGMLLGGLLGVALGVVFAPFAGEKTRNMIMEKLKEMELDDIVERFADAFEEGKEEAAKVAREYEEDQ